MSRGREEGQGRGRRWGWQELNNLLCYWLMLHCRHLELIAALFSFPLYSFTLLPETLSRLSLSPHPHALLITIIYSHRPPNSCPRTAPCLSTVPDMYRCMRVLHVLKLSVTSVHVEVKGASCPVRGLLFSRAVPVLTVFVKLLVVKEIEITAVLAGGNFSYL